MYTVKNLDITELIASFIATKRRINPKCCGIALLVVTATHTYITQAERN